MPPQIRIRFSIAAVALGVACLLRAAAHAQQAPVDAAAGAEADLEASQARLSDRFERLELSIARLAELSGSTQPRRAAILRQLVAQSRDRDVAGQFDKAVSALGQQSYSSAIDSQTTLEGELQNLLELLLQEDRDRQIESEKKRISRFLQDVNKLIRLQRGVTARTDGGEDAQEVAGDQQEVSEKTAKLGQELAESTETKEEKTRRETEQQSQKMGDEQEAESSKSATPENAQDAEAKSGQGEPADAKESKPKSDEASPSDTPPAKPSEGGPPSEGQPSGGNPAEPQQSSQESQETPPPPAERAAQRLKQAQQRMDEAQQKLEEAQRQGAVKDQQQAVEELEQAKAELERILRQLREEELERMLVMIEARIRKMLEEQVHIYDETKQVGAASDKAAEHEVEIASGRLARREGLIVREADRALVLLREDGTSVAFPEAIEQARDDMQSVADRLRDAKVDVVTQELEKDVIAALEETLAAMQQALKELREQKGQPPQQGGGEPGEKPLVDQLAELRMVRSLQARVNRRTKLYGDMMAGEQARADELVQSLRDLGVRQQKIFQATQDLDTKEN